MGLRLWGIAFSPTVPRARPDEEIFVAKGLDYFSGDRGLDVLETGWPEGFFRVVHALQWLEAAVLRVLWGRPVNLGCLYAVHPMALQVWPRVFSALIDVGSCLLVGLIARRLARPEERDWALPFGILALGCNYLVARDAHFGVSDSLLLFTCCLALYGLVRAVTEKPEFLLLAGASVGAGFGVKYAAAPWVVPCLVALGITLARFPNRRRTLVLGALSLLSAVLAFVVASPNALLHFGVFFSQMVNHAGRYTSEGHGYIIDSGSHVLPGWRFYLTEGLPAAFGSVGFVLSLGGIGLIWRRNRGVAVVFGSAVLAAFAMLINLQALFVRYAQPVIPPLAVGLGLLLAAALVAAGQRKSPGWLVGAALIAVAALGFPLVRIVQFDRLLSAPDTRDQALQWLLDHGGGPLVSQGWYGEVHLLDAEGVEACRGEVPPWLWREVPIAVATPNTSREWVREGPAAWGKIAHRAADDGTWVHRPREGARYVAAAQGLLPCGRFARNLPYLPLGPPCYQLATSFDPGVEECSAVMDVFDAMWVPYRGGFDGQRFPGPRLDIYENFCRTGYPAPSGESVGAPHGKQGQVGEKGSWAFTLRELRELPDGGWDEDAGGLGEREGEKIVAASNTDGGLEVFYLSDEVIEHDWQVAPGGAWHGKELLHGLARDIAVARNTDGRLELLGIGTDDKVYRHVQATPGGAWLPEQALGGRGLRIAMAKNADGGLEVFYVGTDHHLYHNWESNLDGGWAGEKAFEGSAQEVAAAADSDGHLNVLYVGDDQRIRENHQRSDTGRWNGDRGLGRYGLHVALAQAADSPLEAFFIDTDFHLFHAQRVPGGWSWPKPMGGGSALQLAAGKDFRGRLELFYLGTDFRLHRDWELGPGVWHGEVDLGLPAGGGIQLASEASGLLDVFYLAPP